MAARTKPRAIPCWEIRTSNGNTYEVAAGSLMEAKYLLERTLRERGYEGVTVGGGSKAGTTLKPHGTVGLVTT